MCTCKVKCSQGNIDESCPVCSAPGADLAALCLGDSPAPLSTQLAAPTNLRWDDFYTVSWDPVEDNNATYELRLYYEPGETVMSTTNTLVDTTYDLSYSWWSMGSSTLQHQYYFKVWAHPAKGDTEHTRSDYARSGTVTPVKINMNVEPTGAGTVNCKEYCIQGYETTVTATPASENNIFAGLYDAEGKLLSTGGTFTPDGGDSRIMELTAKFLVPVEISGYTGQIISHEGNSPSFKVEVKDAGYSSDPLSCQWALSTDGGKSFTDIEGATSAEYTVSNVTGSMNGYQYQCRVTRSLGGISDTESVTCTLYVASVDRPAISLDRNRLSLGGTETLNFTLPEGYSLSSVTAGGKALTEGTDYSLGSQGQLTLSNDFLKSLPVGDTVLSFGFEDDTGTPLNLSATVTVPDCWVVDIKADPEGESGAWIEEYYSYMSTVYVPKGESVQLECVPWGYYEFEGWVENGQTISTDYVFNFVPSGNTSLTMVCRKPDSSTPKTGDSSNLGLWLGLMGLSVLVIGGGAAVYVIKKKKK